MTQPVQPTPPARRTSVLSYNAIVSLIETIAFIVAAIWFAVGGHNDAIISALIGAAAHGVNHPTGGSPL